jgi:metallo-beta-lactamase family protein
MNKSKLGFYGGVGSVTGANFYLDAGEIKILVDCGLKQGTRFEEEENQRPFPYDPATIDVLLVTHAHADHIGRIPKLVREGFKGVIYSTEPTRALAGVMLKDALKVMRFEAEKHGTPLLYEEADISAALALWQTADYEKALPLKGGINAIFSDAGHILGSASITLERDGRKIAFSGDIGNVPQPLLDAPTIPEGYDYLVMESVYGDRKHEGVGERSEKLLYYLEKTIEQQGTLIIPAFSLERTQGMLFELNNLVESKRIKPLPVFLDSPLAIEVTDLYRERVSYLKRSVQKQVKEGDNIFEFPKLKLTRSVKESDAILRTTGARVIIAGSGMSHGGRILKHEQNYLQDPKTILLLVGYQSVGSIGRRLKDGARQINIDGQKVKVRAEIASIQGWSGHADRDQLVDFVAEGGDKAKQVFVTMGEERAALFLVQRLRDYLGVNAIAPSAGEVVEIEF